jgi:hypothetical protein
LIDNDAVTYAKYSSATVCSACPYTSLVSILSSPYCAVRSSQYWAFGAVKFKARQMVDPLAVALVVAL